MVVVTLKMTPQEIEYLDALVALTSNLSRSQVLRDGMFVLGEKYIQCDREGRRAAESNWYRRQRRRKKS